MKRCPYLFILFLFLCVLAPVFAEPGEYCDADEMMYHGKRMMKKNRCFAVRKIEIKTNDDGLVVIDIHFNAPVDPRTVASETILLNGVPLGPGVHCLFNKAGTLLRLRFSEQASYNLIHEHNGEFDVDFCRAASFNGTPLLCVRFPHLRCGASYEFTELADSQGVR